MTQQNSEGRELMERVERLEKQNRKLKQAGAVALILAAAVFLMGQAAQKKTVEANEFILRDTNGKLRAALDIYQGGPRLALYDAAGNVRGALDVFEYGPGLFLSNAAGLPQVGLIVDAKGSEFSMSSHQFLDRDGLVKGGLVKLSVGAGGPGLELVRGAAGEEQSATLSESQLAISDQEGFKATIGTTDLVTPQTGETHKTSAASVVLFDKDKKVIWQAP